MTPAYFALFIRSSMNTNCCCSRDLWQAKQRSTLSLWLTDLSALKAWNSHCPLRLLGRISAPQSERASPSRRSGTACHPYRLHRVDRCAAGKELLSDGASRHGRIVHALGEVLGGPDKLAAGIGLRCKGNGHDQNQRCYKEW